jgi:hypothetical protein
VSYRCAELLDACLASLAPQRADLAIEVIVVDNASRDGTAELVAAHHPWVDFVESPSNVGFARATNHGLSVARGADVLLLNPDTVVAPGALAACLRELHERPSVGMLGCRLVQPGGALDHACKRGFPTPLSALWHFAGLTRLRPRSRRFAAYTAGHVGEHDVATVDAVNGAFMLVRGTALRDVGPLDERFWMYGEDLDWCYRFWKRGWDVLYWPGATVVHVKGGSAKTRSWRTNKAFHQAMWRFYDKHYRRHRTPPVTAAVGGAIALRLAVSALASAALRRRRPA